MTADPEAINKDGKGHCKRQYGHRSENLRNGPISQKPLTTKIQNRQSK